MADDIDNPEAQRSSEGVRGCAVCGASALFGFANDPRVRYCADDMPGLSDADQAIYRQTGRLSSPISGALLNARW